ncbi:MAG: type II and III secretion system protein family protein, partial [Terriglobia bacterium]
MAAIQACLDGSAPVRAAEVEHGSYLHIAAGVKAQPVRLGLNKSMIIELPREVRDVMVSNPQKIDAVMQSATRAYLIGKDSDEANVIFIDKGGNQVATLEVSVERDLSQLDDLLTRLIPGSKIHIDAIGERTVLTGTVPNPIDASRACEIVTAFLGPLNQLNTSTATTTAGPSGASTNEDNTNGSGGGCAGTGGSNGGDSAPNSVINMISVEAREQVLLKVSVVEMERNVVKQFGVDLGALVNSGNFAFAALSKLPFPINPQGGGFIAPFIPNSAGGAVPDATGFPAGVSPGVAGGGVQWLSGQDRVQTILRALEQDGLLHTLAEPNLTAISGETANFLAGGEFPIPVAQQQGQISVDFKKFGIGLSFTPVVMSEGRISLKVSTEVSELSNQGAVVLSSISIPALKVRRAETVVELPSGGSLVMA